MVRAAVIFPTKKAYCIYISQNSHPEYLFHHGIRNVFLCVFSMLLLDAIFSFTLTSLCKNLPSSIPWGSVK